MVRSQPARSPAPCRLRRGRRRPAAAPRWPRAPPRPELALLAARRRARPLVAGRNGWANTYYSAAVRSMSTSWHDFLYGVVRLRRA